MAEWNGHNHPFANPRHFAQHIMRLLRRLQSLAQNNHVKAIVGIIAQIRIGIALHHGQAARHPGIHPGLAQSARVRQPGAIAPQRPQFALAAANIQHPRAIFHHIGDKAQINALFGQITGTVACRSSMCCLRICIAIWRKTARFGSGFKKTA